VLGGDGCGLRGARSAALTLNNQPGLSTKLKGPEAFAPPAHAISIKNKHLLVIYSIPARGFTAAVSVFWGTPPPKPLICKSVSNRLGARNRSRWADPTGREPRFSGAISSFGTTDIIETSPWFIGTHRSVHLSLPPFHRQTDSDQSHPPSLCNPRDSSAANRWHSGREKRRLEIRQRHRDRAPRRRNQSRRRNRVRAEPVVDRLPHRLAERCNSRCRRTA
jgi:hypothetical protein